MCGLSLFFLDIKSIAVWVIHISVSCVQYHFSMQLYDC